MGPISWRTDSRKSQEVIILIKTLPFNQFATTIDQARQLINKF